MNTPTVNACAVDEAAALPTFVETVRDALPDHAHYALDAAPRVWSASWSTPAGMWSLKTNTLGPDEFRPGGKITGPGGTLTFPKGASAGDVVTALTGLGAFPHRTEARPTPAPTMSHEAIVEALQLHLPAHAHYTNGETAKLKQDFVITTTFGGRTEWATDGVPVPRWSAEWTTPAGRFGVELNPRDPSRKGFVITGTWGLWHLPEVTHTDQLVTPLRGFGALIPEPDRPTIKVDAAPASVDMDAIRRAMAGGRLTSDGGYARGGPVRDQHVHWALSNAPRSRTEALTRRMREAMALHAVEKGKRRGPVGRWVDLDFAAAACAAVMLAEEAKSE